jgi:RNA polymerase sigma-70 factor (TIGR02960 family)
VTDTVLTRARAGDETAFSELTAPHLAELRVHCYRILGSAQDAEDALQETLLTAWRGLEGFEGRASLRTWLYRIATSRCLNLLRANSRRSTSDHTAGPPFEAGEPTRHGEPLWLEPCPDVPLDTLPDSAPGPEVRYEAKEAIALAFTAALQHLPPRQRAALILKDVLGYPAAEVASLLDATQVSVNSALQRARATMAAELPARDRRGLPSSAAERDLVERFAVAWTEDDVQGVVRLLTGDAWYTMPPATLEYQGRTTIAGFLTASARWRAGRRYRLIPTRANGQPAFGCYMTDTHGEICHAHGLIVLTLNADGICAVTRFIDSSVMAAFGLPRVLPAS